MHLPRAYQIVDISIVSSLVAAAQDVDISDRVFMIANTGAQPAYFRPKAKGVATALTGMLVPANTVFPQYFSCPGTLSVISNATGTTLSILFLDV